MKLAARAMVFHCGLVGFFAVLFWLTVGRLGFDFGGILIGYKVKNLSIKSSQEMIAGPLVQALND
jgi:hypothetical protein